MMKTLYNISRLFFFLTATIATSAFARRSPGNGAILKDGYNLVGLMNLMKAAGLARADGL